jgi:hypothetical protein
MRRKNTFTFLALAFSLTTLSAYSRTIVNIENNTTISAYTDKEIIITGKTELHLTATPQPLVNSIVRLSSADSWLYIDNMRPALALDSILKYVYVNEAAAVNGTNVRVSIYKHGTLIMPCTSGFQPLIVYTGQNCTGDSAKYSIYTKYTSLGSFDNKIRSFKLKRGYMATLAASSDGTGYSRMFIANDEDVVFNILPTELDQVVSFIRAFKYEWISKKGWCGTGSGSITNCNQVDGTWVYSWSADQNSTSNLEYVPIRQNGGWPAWSEISGKQNTAHVLGFNEPDHTEQSNLTVAEAIAQWPEMLKTGFRVGTPACTNFTWLYQFMDSCKARNYRVDYVAVHAYWSKTPQNWYNDLKAIHDKTGRPLWITEWNNGANWTTEWWPTDSMECLTKQYNDIKAILNVLDTAHFVERYSIYNWVTDKRAMIINGALTPAGIYYRDNKPDVAFRDVNEVVPTYIYGGKPSLAVSFGTSKMTLTITDPNGEYFRGFILEKQLDGGAWTEFLHSDLSSLKYTTDTIDLSLANKVRYRVRSKMADGTLSEYSNEIGMDIADGGGSVQYGSIGVANITWNSVFFRDAYPSIPAIIVGSPTNKNSTVALSSRAKLINRATRFNLQLAPWSYQKVTGLTKEETVPYFVLEAGNYNFGGINAQAGKYSIGPAWTACTFATAFDTIPVVFTSQLISATNYATTVRVRNVTKTGFEARIMKETAITTLPSTESVSFIAMTPGTGVINHHSVRVGKTSTNAIGTVFSSIPFGDSIPNPLFIAQMQTCNDDTTATLRVLGYYPKYATVFKQREKSCGSSYQLGETGGFMVMDLDSNIPDDVQNPTDEVLQIYPNPVRDRICFSRNTDEGLKVEIFTLFGNLVKATLVSGNEIQVNDLPAGCYLLRLNGYRSQKFIKL